MVDESGFNALADKELALLERILDNCGADIGVERTSDGVLEVEFADGSKMIINKQTAAQEIWVASPQYGGFHFKPDQGKWIAARIGLELYTLLSRLITKQTQSRVQLERPAKT